MTVAGGRSLPPVVGPLSVAAGSIVALALIDWADPTTPGGVIPVCPTKALLGIDCPGCGSMRMLYSLVHLDVPSALSYNAIGVLALVLLAWTYVGWTWGTLRRRPVRSWQHATWAPRLVLAVTVVWFVVRNVPVEPFTALRV